MITFFDLIQKDDFRHFVSNRIADCIHEPYLFPTLFPPLYRYRSLSLYAIDDIVNKKITLSSIGEFNDIFDGAIHQYGTTEEIEQEAETQWKKLEECRVAAHLPEGLLRRDDIVKPYTEHLKTESRLKFRELDYLGTYVCCFSQNNCSTLMWAHYADANKGLCIEYDFNNLSSKKDRLLQKSIFPVAYTCKPIDTTDLLSEAGNQIYQYPLDAAVLCAALSKDSVWQYEKEWRIVWVTAHSDEEKKRLPINYTIMPSKIYLGYHFLKSFFYYTGDISAHDICEKLIKKFVELIVFMQKNNISAAVMVPSIGNYQLIPRDISVDALYSFMLQHFRDFHPECMRFYYTIHDDLMDLIESDQMYTHA